MAYTKTSWIARAGSYLDRFTKSEESGTSVRLVNNPVIETAGTEFSPTLMNKIEDGIEDAHLLTVPLNRSSVMSSYTANGNPQFPDSATGVLRHRVKGTWALTDYIPNDANIAESLVDGYYVSTRINSTGQNVCYYGADAALASKQWTIKVRCSIAGTSLQISTRISGVISVKKTYASIAGDNLLSLYIDANTDLILLIQNGATINSTMTLIEEYIGGGLYDSLVYDRTGNNLNFTNTACLPVSGRFGKDFLLNGTTSFLQSVDNFTMPDIFTFHCTLSNTTSGGQMILGQNSLYHLAIYKSSATVVIYYWNGSAIATSTFSNILTSTYHAISITVNRTAGTITAYKDGVLFEVKSGLTIALNTTASPLYFGKRSDGFFLNETLGNIRLDSRAFTADEELRWANDPTTFDASIDNPKNGIIYPLTGTVSSNTTYTLYKLNYMYTVIIPKSYLVASSGGPYTLTLTTGVSGKETVIVPISKSTTTINSGSLNFSVYVDSSGNVTSEAFAIRGTIGTDTFVKYHDRRIEIHGYKSLTTSSAQNTNVGTYGWSYFYGSSTYTYPETLLTVEDYAITGNINALGAVCRTVTLSNLEVIIFSDANATSDCKVRIWGTI